MDLLQIILSGICGLAALSLVVEIVRDRQPGNVSFFALVAIELGLLVQLVWGIVRVVDDHRGVDVGTYVGYLLGALVLLPVGYLWSVSEKNRGGTGVLLVAVVVVPVLLLRLHGIWSAHV
ncbi:MAG: hypothetical protein NTV23_03065 [Propionibacteriales bacterium]|nr:hypothetical protein [Propionibacteriales bacterium]